MPARLSLWTSPPPSSLDEFQYLIMPSLLVHASMLSGDSDVSGRNETDTGWLKWLGETFAHTCGRRGVMILSDPLTIRSPAEVAGGNLHAHLQPEGGDDTKRPIDNTQPRR
eukprot:1438719-Pyramimonas_sp.AAC.1